MRPDDPLLLAELRRDEGVRYSPYYCTAGKLTVGVGHNLDANPLELEYPLTDEQVDEILADDIAGVFSGLDKSIPWWRSLSEVRQRVLVNMAFQLGVNGLLAFKKTIAAICGSHYELAAENMLASKWAKQTSLRAKRLAKMMAEG